MNFLNNLILTLITMSKADAPIAWQLGFQDPATPVMEGIIDLHHDIWAFMTMVSIFVTWMLCRTLYHFNKKSNPTPEKIVHGATLEIVWTTLPAIILAFIAFSSFALLYSLDEIVDPAVTIKVVGAQWYWHYEYSDYIYPGNEIGVTPISFDSYMIADDDLEKGHLRLLEVDNRVVVPVHTHLRFILTAADVIHSWAIPSLGIKTDCVPGRLNQTSAFIKREGIYYGQCSEICGVNHAFMPIVVEAVGLDDYINWVAQKIEESA